MELVLQQKFTTHFDTNIPSKTIKMYNLPVGKGVKGYTLLHRKSFFHKPRKSQAHFVSRSTFIWTPTYKGLHRKAYRREGDERVRFTLSWDASEFGNSRISQSRGGNYNEPLHHKPLKGIRSLNYPQEVYNRLRRKELNMVKIAYTYPLYDPNHLLQYDVAKFIESVKVLVQRVAYVRYSQEMKNVLVVFSRDEVFAMVKSQMGKFYSLPFNLQGREVEFARLQQIIQASAKVSTYRLSSKQEELDRFHQALRGENHFIIPNAPTVKTFTLLSYFYDIVRDTIPHHSIKYEPLKTTVKGSLKGVTLGVKKLENRA